MTDFLQQGGCVSEPSKQHAFDGASEPLLYIALDALDTGLKTSKKRRRRSSSAETEAVAIDADREIIQIDEFIDPLYCIKQTT